MHISIKVIKQLFYTTLIISTTLRTLFYPVVWILVFIIFGILLKVLISPGQQTLTAFKYHL